MGKKLGARWMPGIPLIDPKFSHAPGGGRDAASAAAAAAGDEDMPKIDKDMALVLVLAQDSNVKLDRGNFSPLGIYVHLFARETALRLRLLINFDHKACFRL